ncbi:hypothetical protein ACROYT_G027827 [Oculina patagonica]
MQTRQKGQFETVQDHDAYLDNTEENNEALGFTFLIVLGVIFVIQLIVLILFAYKGWNAVFGSRSVQADPGSQWPNQFPFLPSYDMAINELSAIQHSISNTTTENVTIALLTLTEHWKEEVDKRNAIAAIAIDLSKAFDCLPHELILEKLKFYGMEDKAVALLYSYLSSRYQRVKLGDTFSDWTGVAAGVPQGSILGPLLFNIFMNDLNFAIERCKFMNYADDTKIHTSDPKPQVVEEDINRDLANTLHWFQQNGMKANPEKYQALVLVNSDYDMNIKCVDKRIPISKEIKLLGVTLDNRLKFDAHIADICRKVGGQVNALNRLKNILPCKTKEALYRAFIFPYFTYCSQVWHHCGTRNANKLEKVNERALRLIYKDNSTSYQTLLEWIGLNNTLETRRIQDMLITINSCFQGRAPVKIGRLINVRRSSYNLRGANVLTLPKANSTKYGLKRFSYYAAKQWNGLPENIRCLAGTKDFIRNIRNLTF